eukprot:snap_masked-scaffold_94-processed-gene-0.18-mRNA-1 protein AED:1.00 eAED:1.00 QI:0/0/0/0/1/1/2/0/286
MSINLYFSTTYPIFLLVTHKVKDNKSFEVIPAKSHKRYNSKVPLEINSLNLPLSKSDSSLMKKLSKLCNFDVIHFKNMDQGSQYLPNLFTHLDLTKVGVKTVFLHLNNSFSELTYFLKAFGSNPSFENLYLYFNSEEKRSLVQKKVKNFTIQLRQISLHVDLSLFKPRHLARIFLEISYSRLLSNCKNLSFADWGGRFVGSYGWIICFESLLISNGGFKKLSWKNRTNKTNYLLPFALLLVKHIGETVDVAEIKLRGTSDLKNRVSKKLKILKSMGYAKYNNFVIV